MPHHGLAVLLALACLALPSSAFAQDKKPLRCGTDFEGGVPYFFGQKDDPNKRIGFEVDLLAALSKQLRRPIEYKHAQFDSLLDTLRVRDIDIALNGLEITPQNRTKARFTRPYYVYKQQLIARSDDDRFSTLDDCKQKKLVLGTLSGSAAARLLEFEKVEFKPYDDQEGPFKDLKNGRIDGVLIDLPIAIYYAVPDDAITHRKKDYPGLKLVGKGFAEGYYGVAVHLDDEDLAKQLDDALAKVIESGELKDILTKWHLWSPDQERLSGPIELDEQEALSITFSQFFPLLLQGAGVTVFITIASMALAILLGLGLATARLYGPAPLRWLSVGYIEFFRGIPILLLLYFIYFGLPELAGIKLHPIVAAILGFGLNYAAYEAEIYRAGITSVPVGQWEAAISLGMSPWLTFRRIVFPQAIRTIMPPMTNDLIALFKDTSIVSVISVVELSKQYQTLTKNYGGFLQIGLTTAALYLVMSVPLGYFSRWLEQRWGGK